MVFKMIGFSNFDDVFCLLDMDFFIMILFFVVVGGYVGQFNYVVVNMYMNGFVVLRCYCGFVGFIFNIGVIYGLGFLYCEKENFYEGLEWEGYLFILEWDFYYMFFEVIVVGKLIEDQIYDIIIGLWWFLVGWFILYWYSDLRFCYFICGSDDWDEESDVGFQQLSLKEQISCGEMEEDVVEIFVLVFIKRLQNQFKLVEGIVIVEQSIVELGVDLLVVVEI